MRYIIAKNFSGKSISHLSPSRNKEGPQEIQEVLFPRGAQFRVIEINQYDYPPTIKMEEIEPDLFQGPPPPISESDFFEMYEDLF
jgi:hypothetical protein